MNILPKTLTDKELKFLKTLKSKLKEELVDSYIDLVLFGSKARGDSNKNSDIDLLLVINNKQCIDKADEVLFDVQMQYDIYNVNILIYLENNYKNQLNNSKNLFFGNVKKEGIHI